MIKLVTLFIVFILAQLAGCVQHIHLSPKFQPTSSGLYWAEKKEADDTLSCEKNNIVVEDARQRTSTYYKNFPREVATQWLYDSVVYIEAPLGADNTVAPILISLKKAYVGHLATTKSAIVVINVTQGENKAFYRGRVTNINWWGTSDEYHDALNEALENALAQFLKSDQFLVRCKQLANMSSLDITAIKASLTNPLQKTL